MNKNQPIYYQKLMPRQTEDIDQEKESHLLLWLGHNHPKMKTLEEVWRSSIILETLLSIDREHFLPLKRQTDFTVSNVLQSIEVYINECLGKRLKRKLRASILQPSSLIKLCQLLLYISVYSHNKKKFIEDILSLPTVTQTYLMNVIADFNQSIYVMELNEILDKIDCLQIENERLQNQINDKKYEYQQLVQQHEITKMDLVNSEKELDILKKEKLNLFKQFEIDSVEQYADMYRQLQRQYTDTFKCLIRSQQKQKALFADLTNSKLKIIEDNKLISQLYEEIDSLKAMCRNLRGYPIPQFLEDEPFSPESQNILKENKTALNSIGGVSPIKENNSKNYKLFTDGNQELEEEVERLKGEVKEQGRKLEAYYEIIESQKQVIGTYKNDVGKLKRCNQIRKWKLQELQNIHSDLSKIVFNK